MDKDKIIIHILGLITIISLIGYWSKSYPALIAIIAYFIGIAVMKIKDKKNE